MTKPLLAILLLLPLSVSAGELDGKAIICEKKLAVVWLVRGYRFQEGEVHSSFISDRAFMRGKNGEVFYGETDYSIQGSRFKYDYIVERKVIRWGDSVDVFSLDRQTLVLTQTHPGLDFGATKVQCEVFSTHEDYWEQLENIRKQKQKEADDAAKRNKI